MSDRLINHPFAAGQIWKNQDYTIYICTVDDDLPDATGEIQPGLVGACTEKPFPGRAYVVEMINPNALLQVIAYYKYELQKTGWHEEFVQTKQNMGLAQEEASETPEPPKRSGLGIVN